MTFACVCVQTIIYRQEDQMWRLSRDGTPLSGYPMPTSRFWRSAPSNPDAVFQKLDGAIVFVKGASRLPLKIYNADGFCIATIADM